jgi:hypothetical protein
MDFTTKDTKKKLKNSSETNKFLLIINEPRTFTCLAISGEDFGCKQDRIVGSIKSN